MIQKIVTFLVKNIKVNKTELIAIINGLDRDADGYISLAEVIKPIKIKK